MEPPKRLKKMQKNLVFKNSDAIIFKIGQVTKLSDILN